MRWGGQVRHVFAKDLREVWWLLAGFAAATVMTVVRVTIDQPGHEGSFGWYDFLVPSIGLLLLAWVVLADPPARTTAFWATQPFRPSAMLSAKLLHALPLVLMTVVGMIVVLRWWRMPWSDVLDTVAITAAGTLTVAISAVLMTVIGGDGKSIALGFVTAMATVFVLRQLRGEIVANAAFALWAILVALDLWLVASLYQSRQVRWPARTASSALLVLTFMTSIGMRQPASPPIPPNTPQVQGVLQVSPSASRRRGFAVAVDGIVTDAASVRLRNARIRVVRPDGATESFPVELERTRDRALTGNEPARDGSTRRLTLVLTTEAVSVDTWNSLYVPGASITFDGTVEERGWVESQRAPLQTGDLPVADAGARLRLRMVSGDTTMLAEITGRRLRIRRSSTERFNRMSSEEFKFSLARRSGPVVTELLNGSSGFSTGSDPLPGFRILDERAELVPQEHTDSLLRDTTWWASHELVISRLTPTRVYRMHAETVIPR